MIQVLLVESGSGREFLLGEVRTLRAALRLVKKLDDRFAAFYRDWSNSDAYRFQSLPDSDPLAHYEGADIYCRIV